MTAYEMLISDWSSDVCSSDLVGAIHVLDGRSVRLDQRRRHGLHAPMTSRDRRPNIIRASNITAHDNSSPPAKVAPIPAIRPRTGCPSGTNGATIRTTGLTSGPRRK